MRDYSAEKEIQTKNEAIFALCEKKDDVYIKQIDETIDDFFNIIETYIHD